MDLARLSWMRIISYTPLVVGGLIFFLIALVSFSLWRPGSLSYSGTAEMNNQINLLQTGWDHMPGVEPSANSLRISYLGRAIVQQDGSAGQSNPAVNLYGTHLRATNNFSMSAKITDRSGKASLRLYATPPTIQDEFRVESNSLDFVISDRQFLINEWSGYRNERLLLQKPSKSTIFRVMPASVHMLTIQRSNDTLNVSIDGQKLTAIKYSDYFKQDMWIGLDAPEQNDSWTLSSLTGEGAIAAVNSQSATPNRQPQALQSLAAAQRPGFLVGAATSLAPLVDDSRYYNLAYGGNFGLTTTENALKWQAIHPHQNSYDFKEADAFVSLARKNNLKVQGHTLVFGEANPQWVQDLPIATPDDKANVQRIMKAHITRTVAHFKGKIYAWDVVNEPLADSDTGTIALRPHKWLSAMGEDYISTAFTAARAADPAAKLYINDFGLEADGPRWDAMLKLVTRLKAQDVPLDGVGFQAHVYQSGDEIDPVVLRTHIKQLAKIGLSSHISEMDVHDDNGLSAQAQQYAVVLQACISEPTCTSWSTWGVTDKYNLYASDSDTLQYGKDFLWDDAFRPKPAVTAIRNTLTGSSQ